MKPPEKNRFCTIPPEEMESIPENWSGYVKSIKDTTTAMRWIWNTMGTQSQRRSKHLLWALGISTVLMTVFPRLITILYKNVPIHSKYYVVGGVLGIGMCYGIRHIANYAHERAREWILGLNIGSLDHYITERLFEKSLGQHIQEARLLNNANISKGRERTLYIQSMMLFEGLEAMLALLLAWILLWTVSVFAGMIATLAIVLYVLWALYLNYRVMVVCTPLDAESRILQRYQTERRKKARRVKTAGRTKEELEFMSEWFDDYMGRDRKFWLWYTKQSNRRRLSVGITAIMVIITYGAIRTWNDLSYLPYLFPLIAWSTQIIENVWRIGHLEHNIHWNLPAIQSLMKALNLKPDIVNVENPVVLDPQQPITIEFKNVGHRYSARSTGTDGQPPQTYPPVLRDVSFTINPGEKVGVVGPSGAGKSTIFNLLLRAYQYTSGAILVNGIPIEEIELLSWMGTIGYVPQKSLIWSQSVRYNILYDLNPQERAQVTDERLWNIMRRLRVDFGDRLVNGLDTLVGEEGLELSGGETQRLALGGILLKLELAVNKQARLMLIDEATSHLDPVTEREVQQALDVILGDEVTAIFIAHRLSTIRRNCTKFIVVAPSEGDGGGGTIEAIGSSFEELYLVSPTFRQLADADGIQIHGRHIQAVA